MADKVLNSDFFDEEIIPISQDYQRIGGAAGQNAKHVLVILGSEQYEKSNFAELLHKILASVKLNYEKDVLIFALSSSVPFSLLDFAQAHDSKKVIVFGTPLAQLGVHKLLPKYEVTNLAGLKMVISDDFLDLEADFSKKLKMALWKALQVLVKED